MQSQSITLVSQPSANNDGQRLLPEQEFLPDAYRLPENASREAVTSLSPRVVFIEVTNRCNLLCETCPRTFFTREPIKSLPFDEFAAIAEQFPQMQRAVLHGIGEPLLNKDLPRIIEYLKARDVMVLFNSNGTLLTPTWQEALVRSGLDEFRCSIDGAEPETYARIRGANLLHKIEEGLAGLVQTKGRLQASTPRISIWCVASMQNLHEMPDLVRMAAHLGVPEVYLQRMTYFGSEPEAQYGMARHELAIFGKDADYQDEIIAECEALSAELGIDFHRGWRARSTQQSGRRPRTGHASVAGLPAPVDHGLHHSQRQLPALLHLALYHQRLREPDSGQPVGAPVQRDLERSCLPAVSH